MYRSSVVGIDQDGVPLAEGAAAAILAAQANRGVFQSSEPNARVSANAQSRGSLASNVLSRFASSRASLGLTESRRNRDRFLGDRSQRFDRDAGLDRRE